MGLLWLMSFPRNMFVVFHFDWLTPCEALYKEYERPEPQSLAARARA